jgi:hypothetical protein
MQVLAQHPAQGSPAIMAEIAGTFNSLCFFQFPRVLSDNQGFKIDTDACLMAGCLHPRIVGLEYSEAGDS